MFSVEAIGTKALTVRSHEYTVPTEFLNSLRRLINCNLDIVVLPSSHAQEDYEFLKRVLHLPNVSKGVVLHVTDVHNMAHTVSMCPITTTEDSKKDLLSSDKRKVFLAMSDSDVDPTSKIKNTSKDVSKVLHAMDFQAFVYLKTQEQGWELDIEQSKALTERLVDYLPYNVPVTVIPPGKEVNVLVSPILQKGQEHARATPCCTRFSNNMNPLLHSKYGFSIYNAKQHLLKKEQGRYDIGHLFLLDPARPISREEAVVGTEEEHCFDFHNKFGVPYGTSLTLEYNGKLAPREAFSMGVEELLRLLSSLEMYVKENYQEEIVSGSPSLLVELPRDGSTFQDNIPVRVLELIDHSILAVVRSYLFLCADRFIRSPSDWKETNIFYQIPHHGRNYAKLSISMASAAKTSAHNVFLDACGLLREHLLQVKACLDQ